MSRYELNLNPNEFVKGYKIQIYPNEEQKEYIDRCIELSAFVYNWALDLENKVYIDYLNGKSKIRFYSEFELDKLFSKFRNENEWLQYIPLTMARYQIRSLVNAYNSFFRKETRRPKFKSKKKSKKFIFLRNDRMYFDDNLLRIEGLKFGDKIYTGFHSGWKKKDNIKFLTPQITRTNLNQYYLSFSIIDIKNTNYFSDNNIEPLGRAIGIDLNINDRFVCSNGYRSGHPDIDKFLFREKRLNRRCQKDYRRKRKQEKTNPGVQTSNRAIKRLNRYRKNYKKIHDKIITFIHQKTKKIIKMNPSMIVMEHIDNRSMEKRVKFKKGKKGKFRSGKLTHHANFYQCRRIMENKCNYYGIPFKLASKIYPSSQLCSNCGSKHKIYTSKTYTCPNCGLKIDRDLNAALNLEKLAYL